MRASSSKYNEDAGNTYCHPHSRSAFGYFRQIASGKTTRPAPILKSFSWSFRTRAKCRKRRTYAFLHHRYSTFLTLSVTNNYLFPLEIQVLHALRQTFQKAQTRAIQQACREPWRSCHRTEKRVALLPTEHNRQSRGSPGMYHQFQIEICNLQYIA